MHIKDFEGWNSLKQKLNHRDKNVPFVKEREIWWCSIGINVGDEEDGKNEDYNRPVLIIRKFNSSIFWGIPLTTKIKTQKTYFEIELQNIKIGVQCSLT